LHEEADEVHRGDPDARRVGKPRSVLFENIAVSDFRLSVASDHADTDKAPELPDTVLLLIVIAPPV
jgi:hypothetical protein